MKSRGGKHQMPSLSEMTKDYSVLEKKLEDLESQLHQFFALPVDTPRLQLISDFLVLKNLLSAALSHSEESEPEPDRGSESRRHLEDLWRRVEESEAAFRNWDEVRTPALDCIDAASMCSCEDSHPEEEDGGDGDGFLGRPRSGEATVPVTAAAERGCGGGSVWRKLGATAGGMVVGAVLMGVVMVEFTGCFLHYHMHSDEFFPTPT